MDDVTFKAHEAQIAAQPPKPTSKFKKFIYKFLIVIVLVLGIFIWWKYFYAFGKEGVKSGYLNYVVYKGQMFKTYEGKLIQQGIKSKGTATVQSNEFEFSIKNKRIYDILKMNSGKYFDLQYNEYNGVVPWRGNTVYIVDSILSMRDAE
ncbi:hypothetical protein ACFOWM_11420 [Ferruginibacter yonginensis]|uniref:6-phosphogluconate dehydrogenase n=1 Tax=Ferruginibacter yonginensis TaxID=1310416 RepID=A0ABV8QUE4_9BACT